MEVEAKFRVPDAGLLERLATAPRLMGYDLAPAAARRDVDAFLDTSDRRVLAAGYYLRRRENADGVVVALKQLAEGGADGVLRREEHELRAAADVPPAEWPSGPLRERVLALVGDAELVPLLRLEQERRTRAVSRDGRPVAELSLDAVVVRGAGRARRWHEAELELRGGDEGDLAALSAALRDVWGLTPETRSKFARALEVAGADGAGERETGDAARAGEGVGDAAGDAASEAQVAAAKGAAEGPAAGKAAAKGSGAGEAGEVAEVAAEESEAGEAAAEEPQAGEAAGGVAGAPWLPGAAEARRKRPRVTAGDSMVEAAVAVMRLHYARMLAHEKGTRAGEDPEELHDMRVATRRLRMALRLFDDYLDADALVPVLKGLRRTGRTLGAVRDLDVFRDKTLRYVEALPRARRHELDPLLEAWQVEYEARRAAMVAYLDGRKYVRFVERFGALLAGPPEALAARGAGRHATVRQVLPALLHRDLADVLAAGSHVQGPSASLARFHELRIAGKALRYTLEFFEAPLGRGARPLIEAMKALQDHLGDLQDAVVSCGIVRDVMTWGSWTPPGSGAPRHIDVIVAPGLARYLVARQEEMQRLVETFPQVWPRVAGEEFGGRLAQLLARL